ncbi:MAG: hypothetical protein DMF72_04590 [Acidobacteria bacterium]|nr:MAG: hypothetical protein DMF72_04590 [Acidobacteriota bacterium]
MVVSTAEKSELTSTPVESLPRLFVIVPTYNRWGEARKSLECLARSSYANFGIILVEDGCVDETVASCREQFPDVEMLHGDGTLWWSGAINLGTQYALDNGAELIMWINDDVLVAPDTIERLVATIRRNGVRTVACARTKSTDPNIPDWKGEAPAWHPDAGKNLRELPEYGDVSIQHPPGGRAVVIPAQCFRDVGFIDVKNFPHYWADHDFHYRAMQAGYKYFITAESFVWNVPNEPRRELKQEFSLGWMGWFLTDRRSSMNMPTLRRLLKRHLPRHEYRKIFYPLLFRHLKWLAYEWLIRKPLLHRPLRAVKNAFSKAEPNSSPGR